jgi:hypothetical protein
MNVVVQKNPSLETLEWEFKLGQLLKDSLPKEIAMQGDKSVLVYLRSI